MALLGVHSRSQSFPTKTSQCSSPKALLVACHVCRALQQQLPQIDDLNARELPGLAKLHLGSSANLMKTFRLLAPSVFNDNSTLPDASLFLQLEGSDLEVVTVLIELQLFHLQRASALIAHAKQRLRYARPRM